MHTHTYMHIQTHTHIQRETHAHIVAHTSNYSGSGSDIGGGRVVAIASIV